MPCGDDDSVMPSSRSYSHSFFFLLLLFISFFLLSFPFRSSSTPPSLTHIYIQLSAVPASMPCRDEEYDTILSFFLKFIPPAFSFVFFSFCFDFFSLSFLPSYSILLFQLSAVPASMPCRDEEYDAILSHLLKFIPQGGCRSSLYLSGLPGTGKTAAVYQAIRELNKLKETQVRRYTDTMLVVISRRRGKQRRKFGEEEEREGGGGEPAAVPQAIRGLKQVESRAGQKRYRHTAKVAFPFLIFVEKVRMKDLKE